MVTRRVVVNLIVFLTVSVGLIALGVTQLLMQTGEGVRITADFTDSGGLLPRNDVTMRGVTVGSVTRVGLTTTGVEVEMVMEPGVDVPRGSQLSVLRRSPIGDLIVDISPGSGPSMQTGDHIPVHSTKPPPDAGKTIEVLADVLRSVPAEELDTLVHELAVGLKGRGEDLARLAQASADLPERLLEVNRELTDLIETGPEVTSVFAEEADIIADDIRQTAVLADILRDRRFDLVELYRNGARFSRVAGDLIVSQKPNISCLIQDFADINRVMAKPRHLRDLVASLRLNHFFFRAVEELVQKGLDGLTWFRVQLLPHTEPQGRQYIPQKPPPDVFAGNSCTSPFGPGVPATTSASGNAILAPGSELHDGR
ncbi:MAG TPA: MlaD family protein [Actinomycetota bacterium]|nr:MlaD family protein [Actinomycetota bacterium]